MLILRIVGNGFIQLITLFLVVGLVAGLVGQVVRDYSTVFLALMYIPLLPLAILAIIYDGVRCGKSLWRWRYGLSLLGGAGLLVGVATGQGLQVRSPLVQADSGAVMRLLHWNVRWGGYPSGHWAEFIALMRSQSPDFIVISEPPRRKSLISDLQTALGIEWQPIMQVETLLIASRYPFKLSELHRIGRSIAVRVSIELPDRAVLHWLVVDGQRDIWRVSTPFLQEIYALCAAYNQAGTPIAGLVGDFNRLGNSRGFDVFLTDYQLAARAAGVWRGSWHSAFPLYDIDHVWLSHRLRVRMVRFFGHFATDHRGQVVEFE